MFNIFCVITPIVFAVLSVDSVLKRFTGRLALFTLLMMIEVFGAMGNPATIPQGEVPYLVAMCVIIAMNIVSFLVLKSKIDLGP